MASPSRAGRYQPNQTPHQPAQQHSPSEDGPIVIEEGARTNVNTGDVEGMAKPPTKFLPQFKFILFMIFVNVVLFVVEIGENGWAFEDMKLNPLLGPTATVLLQMGAQRSDLIFDGEWWRLITAMFLHAGLYVVHLPPVEPSSSCIRLHLFFNMLGLYQLGVELENAFDRRRIVFIYFTSGIVGAICSAVFVPDTGLGMGFAMLSLPTNRQDRLLNTRSPRQRLLGKIGGTFTFLFALLFIILLATHSDASKACSWCKYLDCVPAPWWSCDTSGGQCYGHKFTNGTLIVTCPGGRNVSAPVGSDFTAAVCSSVCT
ncbi:hypothetical protein B5M09_007305 [Aphanomyces astaci]|uniref:rhomboid protease n=1 Tax=Aphanomyces astaci TaxID=112090 RepID=A0A425D181_APHAT|nr:hypothetical protein B5M09_007305 [Aphanomyces astaci]